MAARLRSSAKLQKQIATNDGQNRPDDVIRRPLPKQAHSDNSLIIEMIDSFGPVFLKVNVSLHFIAVWRSSGKAERDSSAGDSRALISSINCRYCLFACNPEATPNANPLNVLK